MSFCTFADGAAMFDATPIENLFLTEYMYEAPAAALKVYLYARMLALHPELGGTLSDMAKALRIGEEEVYDAFTYWEHRGLMRRLTDQPPTYAFQPMRAPAPAASSALDREMYANRDFNSRLRKLFNDQFIGDHELRKAADWQSILKFEQDAILRMVAYGIEKSPRKNPKPPSVFKRVDDMAEAWSKKGIRTLEDVERAIAEETGEAGLAREALKKLGIYRDPSQPELELVRRWTGEWGYDREAILAACDKTTNAQKPTLKYLDSILERQRDEGQSFYADVAAVLRELTPGSTIPSPDQLAQYRRWIEQGYLPETIRLAAVQSHRLNKNRFEDLEWRLNVWREAGLSTPEQVTAYTREMTALSRELRTVLLHAGSEKRPSPGDLEKYRGWKARHSEDLILYAAECARGAGGSMAYMDRLLTRWAEAGATTVDAAKAEREAFKSEKAPAEKPANPALGYAQREYKEEDFGDDFYFDYDKFFGSEEKKP